MDGGELSLDLLGRPTEHTLLYATKVRARKVAGYLHQRRLHWWSRVAVESGHHEGGLVVITFESWPGSQAVWVPRSPIHWEVAIG